MPGKQLPMPCGFRELRTYRTLKATGKIMGLSAAAVRALVLKGPLVGSYRWGETGKRELMVHDIDLREFLDRQAPSGLALVKQEPMGLAIRVAPRAAPAAGEIDVERLLRAFLAGRNANTRQAYATDLEAFRQYLGATTPSAAVERFLFNGHGQANALALDYRGSLTDRGLSSASVNRHLASLRSLVKVARLFGMVPWTLEVPNLRVQPYRDTRGPGREGFIAMISHLAERGDAKGVRDIAILRLLFERALRCNEACLLDMADVDFSRSSVNVLGKGRTEKEWLTIAPSTLKAIQDWVRLRGDRSGPLFHRVNRNGSFGHGTGRLTRMGIFRAVREAGAFVGLKTRPHGLRHAAITDALDRGEPIRSVQRFSRHKDFTTLLIYDDNRTDMGGVVARAISGFEPPGTGKPIPTAEEASWRREESARVRNIKRGRK